MKKKWNQGSVRTEVQSGSDTTEVEDGEQTQPNKEGDLDLCFTKIQ